MAKVPDPRRAREEVERTRAFYDAMQRFADAPGLREELAEACGHATMPNDGNLDVGLWVMCDPAGKAAAEAVRLVLARRGFPHQLVTWALTLGVCGAANPSAAIEYLNTHFAPAFAREEEPLTGRMQIVLRVPSDWSEKRIHAWTRRAVAQLRAAISGGEPMMSTPRGGGSVKATSDEAVSAARRFDEQFAAKLASESGPRVVALKRWLREFDAWLANENQSRLGTASSLWKLHLRDAVRRAEFLPAAVAFRPRTPRARN